MVVGSIMVMTLASASIALDPFPSGDDAPASPPAATPPGARENDKRRAPAGNGMMSVEVSMKVIARAARTLEDQLRDAAKRDENVALIIDMQRGCVIAKSQPLPQSFLKDVASEARKAELASAYATGLRELLRELVELEQSVVDGKLDDAATRLARVGDMRDRVHKALGMED